MGHGIPCPIFRLSLILILVLALLILVVLILIVLVLLILILILILISVLVVIHGRSSIKFICGFAAKASLPHLFAFILCLEENTACQTGEYCGADPTGAGFQTTGENSQKTVLIHRVFHALCKIRAETGQWNRSTGSGKVDKMAVDT